jgi:hypothetical protein
MIFNLLLILLLLYILTKNYLIDKFGNFKVKNTNYIFIHIPKNAGTSFSKTYCKKEVGHTTAQTYSIEELKKSIAIIRNPYDRLISCYNYFKMNNNYWSKKYGNPVHHDYCKKHSFKDFVDDLYHKKIDFDIHLLPQVHFLKKDGKIYTKLLKLENIKEDFYNYFGEKINLPLINKSKNHNVLLDTEDKRKIYEIYKEDFELLNYSK